MKSSSVRSCVDRLARSIGDLQDIVRELKAKGATLKATEQPTHTSSGAGSLFALSTARAITLTLKA
jgi:DNA invertase Pin-like site-specific DNA recombinase